MPPLVLNPNLTILAQSHAENLAKEKKFMFSDNKLKNEKIGENIYIGAIIAVEKRWYPSGREGLKSIILKMREKMILIIMKLIFLPK